MKISRLYAEQYRSFQELDLEIRPLTLIYGENSTGKSAILKLLPIISESLSPGREALNLSAPFFEGGSFEDLIFIPSSNQNMSGFRGRDLRLGLCWRDGLYVRWNLAHASAPGGRRAAAVWDLLFSDTHGSIRYGHPDSDWLPSITCELRALSFPMHRLYPDGREARLAGLQDRLRLLIGRTQYLGARRARLPRSLAGQRFAGPLLNDTGSDALAALSADVLVENELRGWFSTKLSRHLERHGSGDQEQWTLAPEMCKERKVLLADAGVGISQILPELVALSLRRSADRPDGAEYLCFEEPATHLHDRMQILAGERFATVAAEPEPVTMLIETHSRPLLTGVQLAIARGQLPADRVILHWIEQDDQGESRISTITFAPSGLPVGDRLASTFQAETAALADLADLAMQAW